MRFELSGSFIYLQSVCCSLIEHTGQKSGQQQKRLTWIRAWFDRNNACNVKGGVEGISLAISLLC
jgi:hypothetical protein